MLLVYDCQTEIAEYNIVFYQRMCAYYDAYAAVLKSGMDLSSLCGLGTACKQCRLYAGWLQELLNVFIMLLGKHFSRRHYACLKAVSYCYQCCEYGNHCLAAPDISLKKPVHLMPALHVVADLRDHPFLSTCEREGKCLVTSVECITDLWHDDALLSPAPHIFLFQKR